MTAGSSVAAAPLYTPVGTRAADFNQHEHRQQLSLRMLKKACAKTHSFRNKTLVLSQRVYFLFQASHNTPAQVWVPASEIIVPLQNTEVTIKQEF